MFDVIIVGGSYSGLSAALALGRALKSVLIIDDNQPCNKQTPISHNFITQDGKTPGDITGEARSQVMQYPTVTFYEGLAINGIRLENGFEIQTQTGAAFRSKKLIFATGLNDLLPDIEGYAACWGISVLHCPYCHGYEVRQEKTGILDLSGHSYELSGLISNWTDDLTLYSNGPAKLTVAQLEKLASHGIAIIQKPIAQLEHINGHLQNLVFKDGSSSPVKALYTRNDFEQKCRIPESLGCLLNEEGYISINISQETSIQGVYACGDNSSRMRTLANAVASGNTAGMALSKKMIFDEF